MTLKYIYKSKIKYTAFFIVSVFLLANRTARTQEPLEEQKNLDYIEVSRDFTLFTSQNLAGYLKPLFTTAEESFNSHLYTKARYDDFWNIALDISVNGMFVPNSDKMFNAELPEGYAIYKDGILVVDDATVRGGDTLRQVGGHISQPTIYGGTSYGIFTARQVTPRESIGEYLDKDKDGKLDDINGDGVPDMYFYDDSTFRSVAWAEGNNVDFMSGVPTLQIIGGFPTRTQVRFRFWGVNVQERFMSYFGIIANQQVDHFFNLFGDDTTMGLAVNLAYHNVSRSKALSINSWSFGAHISKTWDIGLTAFGGLQWETINGTFEARRESITDTTGYDYTDSPYLEIHNSEPITFDIEGFNSWRLLGGLSFRTGIFEFHGEAAWAHQPILSAGLTLWIASWGEKKREQETIEQYEKIEKIERIERKEIKK